MNKENKPQPNLEEWLDTQTWRVDYGANVGRFEKDRLARAFAREVAKQTCDAVRVGNREYFKDLSISDPDNMEANGWNSAIKAQEDNERSWMGEGGRG